MFLNAMWILNVLHLSWLAGAIRFTLFCLMYPFRKEWTYSKPENVGGYLGGIDFPGVGVLAFRKGNGKLQFLW